MPTTAPLPPALAPTLFVLAAQLEQELEAALSVLQLAWAHAHLLLTLHQTTTPPSQRSLGTSLRIDRSTMVKHLDLLQTQGLLSRVRNPDDRRAHLVQLSPKGAALIPLILQLQHQTESLLLQTLTPTQRGTLLGLLDKATSPYLPPSPNL